MMPPAHIPFLGTARPWILAACITVGLIMPMIYAQGAPERQAVAAAAP